MSQEFEPQARDLEKLQQQKPPAVISTTSEERQPIWCSKDFAALSVSSGSTGPDVWPGPVPKTLRGAGAMTSPPVLLAGDVSEFASFFSEFEAPGHAPTVCLPPVISAFPYAAPKSSRDGEHVTAAAGSAHANAEHAPFVGHAPGAAHPSPASSWSNGASEPPLGTQLPLLEFRGGCANPGRSPLSLANRSLAAASLPVFA